MPITKTTAVKVFISYSRDSDSHAATVLNLAQQLRGDGVEATIDQYVLGSPAEGWTLWMERQIEQADFVCIVCTETYLRRWKGLELLPKGRGATWESILTREALIEAAPNNTKYVPVLFDGATTADVPMPLRPYTRYHLPGSYGELLRYVTGQPSIIPRPVGPPKTLPPTVGPATPATLPLASGAAAPTPAASAKPPGRIKIEQAIATFKAKYKNHPLEVDLEDGVWERTTQRLTKWQGLNITLSGILGEDTFLLDLQGIRAGGGIGRNIPYGAVEDAYVGSLATGSPAIGLRLSVRLVTQGNNDAIHLERY